jgi:hypothetical protein
MPRWQSNFNKNSVTAKLVSEIAVEERTSNPYFTGIHSQFVGVDGQTANSSKHTCFRFHFSFSSVAGACLATCDLAISGNKLQC